MDMYFWAVAFGWIFNHGVHNVTYDDKSSEEQQEKYNKTENDFYDAEVGYAEVALRWLLGWNGSGFGFYGNGGCGGGKLHGGFLAGGIGIGGLHRDVP